MLNCTLFLNSEVYHDHEYALPILGKKISTECPTKNELLYTSFKKKGIDMFLFTLQTFSSIRRRNGWKQFVWNRRNQPT